jgi:tetratricopeptide (TPR) repeat protein
MIRHIPRASAFLAALLWAGAAFGDAAGGAHGSRPGWTTALQWFGFALLALAAVWLPSAGAAAWRRLRALPRGWLVTLAAVVAIGAVLRLFVVPGAVVTEYMGYQLTNIAAEMVDIPRYGVGSEVLWRALFLVAPIDHASVIGLHAALGSLTLVWLAAVLLGAGLRPAGAVLATALAAFLPQFVWADASDSLTVPALFWTLGAILFAQEYLARRTWSPLVGAVAWLAFAAHTRPEHVFFGPLLLAVFVAAGGTAPRLRDRLRVGLVGGAAAAVGYALLVLPQVLYALHMRDVMMARGGWPNTFADILPQIPSLFVKANALLDPEMVPLALLPLALVGLVWAPSWAARRLRLALLGLGVAWLCFYYIDLSVASLPRLHVVLALPAAIVAGALLGDLWALRPARNRWLGPALAAVAAGAVLAGVPTAAAALFHPTNEDEEEAFFRAALEKLPAADRFVFVHLGRGDKEPGDQTHHHHPDYLVRPPVRQGFVMSVSELAEQPLPPVPVYWYKGMRCFSRHRREYEPPPATFFAPACWRMESTFVLEPVLEREVENHGDRMLPYYSTEPRFRLGLYRVIGRRTTAPSIAGGATSGAAGAAGAPPAPPAPDLPKARVIPPGQEALILALLGDGEDLAGCRHESAAVEQTHVRASYRCGDRSVPVHLRSADDPAAPPTAERTAQFAVVVGEGAPPGFAAAVAASVRAHEGPWRWGVGLDPATAAAQPPPPVDEGSPAGRVSPEYERKYWILQELLRDQRHAEATELCIELARENDRFGGILGLLVANLAPTKPDAARVAAYGAAADAAPDDPLAQYIAGVAAHYSAHYRAQTVEEKKALYAIALRYLQRALPAYDFEPRVYIYLAVSHFRLGHQEEAERMIDRALTLDRKDPDAWYCRAEIHQHKEPAIALADLERYIEMTSDPGSITFGDKPQRVQRMKERLQARLRGEAVDEELFDPIEPQ